MTGMTHISDAFAAARLQGRAALIVYYTLGYPTPQASLDVLESIACSGADLIELGLPFSDPLADGPTIQHSAQVALEQGMSMARCLELAARLRARGVEQPLLLMGYINPILAYGIERFVNDATAAGVDGLIIPDLPPEEAAVVETACRSAGLANVFLLAPTSTAERMAIVAAHSSGFVYLVSIAGTTGAKETLPPDLLEFIQRVRPHTDLPLAVGFGISTSQQANLVGQMADGVIVGSAVISAAGRNGDPAGAVAHFVAGLREALSPSLI